MNNTMDMTRIDARKMQMTGDLIGEELGHGRWYCRGVRSDAATRNVPSSKLASE